MPGENENQPNAPPNPGGDQPNTPPVPNAPPQAPQTPPTPPSDVPEDGSKAVTLTSRTLKERIEKAKQVGKSAALRELEAKAQALGFTSVDAMFAHMERTKVNGSSKNGNKPNGQQQARQDEDAENTNGTPNAKPTPPQNRRDRRAMERYERDLKRWQKQAEQAQFEAKQEKRHRRDLQRRLDASEARSALERVAMSKGIRDVDYAITLLTRHLDGKPEEEINSFDESKFFEGLRSTHGHVFGEVTLPATTGTGAQTPPAPPKPGAVNQKNANDGRIDANKMSRTEYDDYIRRKGFNPNAL